MNESTGTIRHVESSVPYQIGVVFMIITCLGSSLLHARNLKHLRDYARLEPGLKRLLMLLLFSLLYQSLRKGLEFLYDGIALATGNLDALDVENIGLCKWVTILLDLPGSLRLYTTPAVAYLLWRIVSRMDTAGCAKMSNRLICFCAIFAIIIALALGVPRAVHLEAATIPVCDLLLVVDTRHMVGCSAVVCLWNTGGAAVLLRTESKSRFYMRLYRDGLKDLSMSDRVIVQRSDKLQKSLMPALLTQIAVNILIVISSIVPTYVFHNMADKANWNIYAYYWLSALGQLAVGLFLHGIFVEEHADKSQLGIDIHEEHNIRLTNLAETWSKAAKRQKY